MWRAVPGPGSLVIGHDGIGRFRRAVCNDDWRVLIAIAEMDADGEPLPFHHPGVSTTEILACRITSRTGQECLKRRLHCPGAEHAVQIPAGLAHIAYRDGTAFNLI